MKKFQNLKTIIETVSVDAEKFYTNGNKAAGVRLRKAMLELRKEAQAVREDVSEIKKKATV